MEKILQYKFDHKQRLIYETFRGDIYFNDFVIHEEAKLDDPEHNDSYPLLVDIREARFIMSDEEKEIIYSMFHRTGQKINMKRKCAIITYDPLEFVTAQLFKNRMEKISSMVFRVFSTEEAAYTWL